MSPALESGGYRWGRLPSVPVFPRASCLNRVDLSWNPVDESTAKARRAARVCMTCPHLVECGLYAIKVTPPMTGIWGGLTTVQRLEVLKYGRQHRSVLVKARQDEADLECSQCGALLPSPRGLAIHLGKIHSKG